MNSLIIGDLVVKPYGKLPYVGQVIKGYWESEGERIPCEVIEIKSLAWDGRDLNVELCLKIQSKSKSKQKPKLKLIVNEGCK